ncbi:MAG TPA: universal stress protein [Anaerolineales bacterium]|nr:universal stress protein [Anaerolineales bacterium]
MFKKILVTLDGSEFAERALEPALQFARQFKSELILLRVPIVEARVAVAYGMGVPSEPDLKHTQDEAEAYLYSLQLRLTGSANSVRTEVISGVPSDIILGVAEANKADLIIMSTHGRSGLSRLVYGSVAESVLRGSRVPVLLIPIKE